MKRQYNRDKRSPQPKSEIVSKMMSANKAKNTKPEKTLREELWNNNMKGYRTNYKRIPGRPDVTFVSKKLALFVNGCFWHRCPHCNLQLPKHNPDFWKQKFDKNIERDLRKKTELESLGWHVITLWECEIIKDIKSVLKEVQNALNK